MSTQSYINMAEHFELAGTLHFNNWNNGLHLFTHKRAGKDQQHKLINHPESSHFVVIAGDVYRGEKPEEWHIPKLALTLQIVD